MHALRLACALLAGLLAVAACATNGDMTSSSSGTTPRGTQDMGNSYTRGGGGSGGY
ncbi:hypothetical protein B7R78_0001265 [Ralstonia solanacearum]|uniref:hypothetical protein n=1 Tax=Ralstonia solanacearum TaxID=305 RepID=UPI0015E88D73|nr:hypothetical protein [Ralstonia solanacearum]MBT1535817.1 hypothetical protein [Ralstonia solanacearum]